MRVAVVGAGISGLAAAHRLRTLLGNAATITVLEQRDRIGGVLRTVDLAGLPFDVGAEAFLARRPEVPALLSELGLSEVLVHPTAAGPTVRAGGRTVPLPGGTVLGVPAGGARLDGLLTAAGVAAVAAEPDIPFAWRDGGDVALGGLLRARFGDELADRLADPLLGGVYAGRVDALGLRATIPTLAAALDAGAPSLTAAADAVLNGGDAASGWRASEGAVRRRGGETGSADGGRSPGHTEGRGRAAERGAGTGSAAGVGAEDAGGRPRTPDGGPRVTPGPVFGGLRGGYRVLLDALVRAARADVRLGSCVRAIERTATGWLLVLGPTTAPEALDVDAVVLAVPAPAVAKLLAPVAPATASAAAEIELASSAVVACAFRAEDARGLATSGTLVAAGEPMAVKGVTHSSTKWAHLGADGLVRLRASLGRFGEARTLQYDDDELVRRVRADLAALTGITAPPVEARVQRWGGGLPQYGVGHVTRIATLTDGLPPGIAVAGAALHGVGVPACIASGHAAARRIFSIES